MKTLAKSLSPDRLHGIRHAAPRVTRSELGHETEVIRGLTLAAPIAVLLWVPLIAIAVRFL